MDGIRISPIEIASSSNWLFKIVSCPARLSCMVSAIRSAVPSQLLMALFSFSISPGAAFITARNPLMAFFPTNASALAARSDSDICANAARQSVRISPRLRILPSALVVCTVSSPNASPTKVTSPVRLVSMVLMAVPAWEDLIPAFAISPMALEFLIFPSLLS